MTPPLIAIAQLPMHWTVEENLREIEAAMCFAAAEGAALCALAELAVTGFHRGIVTEGVPQKVDPALQCIADWAGELALAVAVGAPSFAPEGRHNSHVLIDADGTLQARVHKNGLTTPEATFFQPGTERPVATLAGLRCSAVICREIEDHAAVLAQLQGPAPELLFWPGQMRPDPARPVVEPWAHVQDAMRLARDLGAWIVQSNWPNALNRPEDSTNTGASAIVAPDGRLVAQLPVQGFGVGLYRLGDAAARWVPLETVHRTMQD